MCPPHLSLAEKVILDVSCSKLKALSNRDDKKAKMRVSGEDVVLPSPG